MSLGYEQAAKDNWSKMHIVKQVDRYWYPMYLRNGQHVPYNGGATHFNTPLQARNFLSLQFRIAQQKKDRSSQ